MLSLNTYVRLCRLLDRLGIPLFGSLHYIGGSDTLPAPLAREEEARLLAALEGEFAHSQRVLRVTGVDNVCERAAMMGAARLVVGKTAWEGVTAALAEVDWTARFGP